MQPNTLKKLLGHEDIETTLNTYCDVFEKLQSDNVRQYESYMGLSRPKPISNVIFVSFHMSKP